MDREVLVFDPLSQMIDRGNGTKLHQGRVVKHLNRLPSEVFDRPHLSSECFYLLIYYGFPMHLKIQEHRLLSKISIGIIL